jgi:hypothetical protein
LQKNTRAFSLFDAILSKWLTGTIKPESEDPLSFVARRR